MLAMFPALFVEKRVLFILPFSAHSIWEFNRTDIQAMGYEL